MVADSFEDLSSVSSLNGEAVSYLEAMNEDEQQRPLHLVLLCCVLAC